MKKIRVAVLGSQGRMGQALLKEMRKSSLLVPYLGINQEVKKSGYQFASKLENCDLSAVDLLIDFSSPKACVQAAKMAKLAKLPFISGTTGLSEGDTKELKKTSRAIPILWSANMSWGIMLLRRMLRQFAHAEDFAFTIEETHHRFKKDKPSGTAIVLAKDLSQALGRKQVKIKSFRKANVVGVHKIEAASENEILVLQHKAKSREAFASGALQAASWILAKKPGLYSLEDVFDDLEA